MAVKTELELISNCMAQLRDRINLVQAVGAHTITTGNEQFDIDLVFVQFRKVLELIAFASLIANPSARSKCWPAGNRGVYARAKIIEIISACTSPF